ncbi:nonsense-mediated mRNA decay factor SMG5-like [Ruditapes philippinarum]|uniref:nonsense-mediated mRNA decay factor SMG5-like n=1 Tax=Ruditapes philippinarum TaxID=129788 RepID=UPI00295B49BF|nr:nonsense-mediated mRNA decay factor SMG5-like [Ruditapes philippinarum]
MTEKLIDLKTDLDKAKKVYRAAVDAVRKLDEGLKKKRAYREVFHQDAVGLRYKLREYCERLMFYNPLYYGRKAEEVLWRKVFYEIIQLIKKNRRHVRVGSSLETAYRTHLSSACGYYYHLLFRLQRDFNLKLETRIDFPLLPDNNPGRFSKTTRRKEVTPAMHEWAMKSVHRCLICLGDIARYQQDFDSGMSGSAAERFYQQALMLAPEMGMAHNQLGTLASSRYFNCEAAYHYIRCMACDVPFEGAEGNLQRLFEKNQKRFTDLKTDSGKQSNTPKEQCYQDLKAFFVRFLQLLKVLYDVPISDTTEIQECCQTTLQSFNHCMFYEPVSYSDDLSEENIHYMEDDIVFKIVVICIATVYILQKRGSRKVTAAIAFLLALFSHILNHVVIRLQGALYEKENPNKILQSNTQRYNELNGEDSESDKSSSLTDTSSLKNGHVKRGNFIPNQNSDGENKPQLPKKQKKSKVRNLRRRRPRSSKAVVSDDSDLSDISDLSEGGDELRDDLSDESEEEPLGFYDDSDSDMSDSFMKSQELDPGFATNPDAENTNSAIESTINKQNTDFLPPVFQSSEQSKIWSDITRTDSLATFSSELFSSSVPFLGGALKLSQQTDGVDSDVIQGRKQVPVPPGFAASSEAKHVEEISQKLANFVIETDTETSITATEAEFSGESDEKMVPVMLAVARKMIKSERGQRKLWSSEEEKEAVHQQNVVNVIQGEGLLSVIKVMCDWMMCNSSVIMTCAQSSQSVWCRLSVLLNFLPHESSFLSHDQCWQDELRSVLKESKSGDWKQKIPLREDINLTKFPPLKHVQEELDRKMNVKLTDLQESFLRTCCLRQFGYFLSGLEGLQFTYNIEKKLFIGPAQPISIDETEEVAMEKMADTESRRNQLMRDMAQLRLQAEVSELEGSLSMTDSVPFPPYLIPDTSSLCAALPSIKKLSQTNRSIIVIPLAVIDSLDHQKKESHGARDAIRWLEAEFRKGNRYIRAQKNSEKIPAANTRHLKKKYRDTWCALEIVNCALYLSRQGGDFGADTVIAILTSSGFNAIKNPVVKQTLATSKQEGVSVENITEFVNKWSEVLNKG